MCRIPSTSQINRFYTREFFAEAKQRLTEQGVLSFALGRYENRISDDLARAVAVAHRTLAEQFANVLVIPTERLRFLASDGPLTTEIADRLESSSIPVRLLDRHYLQVVLAPTAWQTSPGHSIPMPRSIATSARSSITITCGAGCGSSTYVSAC